MALKAQYSDFVFAKIFDIVKKHKANNRTENTIKNKLDKILQNVFITLILRFEALIGTENRSYSNRG